MSEHWNRISPHLDRALEMTSSERASWLSSLRAGDAALAATIERLLEERSQLSREGFLAGAAAAPGDALLAGETLGAYTLVKSIGQGGMGSVWLARRSDGRFEGTAAVKLLNLSLVGRAGEERFRREGSLLARLKHPHIAQLLDAGVSRHGQPYLVLEYVEGEHIDEYCRSRALDVEARIRLFLEVTAAVAHAHANLIVHRDIKPSNVLVGRDGRAKLLDFGIAKLLESDPSGGSSALTREGGAALTPRYAAPEQIAGGEITTATDVHALGGLLYVLLSGRHPRTDAVSSGELFKRIVESEVPPLPSAVTSDILRRRLRGDLETIVGTALKNAPAERYAEVAGLAADLRRFLANQPIAARPDSLGYRASKFIQRHWRGLAVAAAMVLVLGGVLAFYTARLSSERSRARLEAEKATRVNELLTDLLSGADPYRDAGKELTVKAVLDTAAGRIERELAGHPALHAEMLRVVGRAYRNRGQHAEARPLLERALALARSAAPGSELVGAILNELGALLRDAGDPVVAGPILAEALAIRRQRLGNDHKDVAVTLVELGRVYADRGLHARASVLLEEALALRRRVLGEGHRETATSLSDLGLTKRDLGDLPGAEALLRQSLAVNAKALPPDHPNLASSVNNLALVLGDMGRHAESEPLLRQSLAAKRKSLGETHSEFAKGLNNLSGSLRQQGKNAEAAMLLDEALRIARLTLDEDHSLVATIKTSRARVHLAVGEPAAAMPLLEQALRARRRVLREDDWRVGVIKSLLGDALLALDRPADAEPLLLQAQSTLKDIPGPQGKETAATAARIEALARLKAQTARPAARPSRDQPGSR